MRKIKMNQSEYELPNHQVLELGMEIDVGGPILRVRTARSGRIPIAKVITAFTEESISEGGILSCQDLVVVLRGVEGWSTFVHSLGGDDGLTLTASWARGNVARGDVNTFVLPIGKSVNFRVVLVSASDDGALFVDPIIRNGLHESGTHQLPP